jgi:endonuclease G
MAELTKGNYMKKLFYALLLFLPSAAFASPCDQFYPNGKEIVVPDTTVLCNSFFVSVFDQKTHANIFSSEIVQPRVKKVERTNNFRADKRIPNSPTPEDYTNTGYDRGHMVPAADADDQIEMSDTFLMTNMTPQLPSVNRIAWKNLEDRVRSVPFKYVVTGAYYSTAPKTIGVHAVPVPDMLYKVVFFESGNTAVYIVDNIVPKSTISTMSLDALEAKIGYKLR